MTESRLLSVAVIGRTGDGKSSLLNSMMQKQVFHHAQSKRKMSTTTIAQSNTGNWMNDTSRGKMVCIDTPGILDEEHVTLLNESHLSQNLEGFFRCVCLGVNAFILVFNVEDFVFGDQTQGILSILGDILGDKFWKHLVIVFTHCDPDKDTWIDKKTKYTQEVPELFKRSFGVENIPQFYLSNQATEGFDKLYAQIKDWPLFESQVLTNLAQLVKEDDKVKVDKYLYDVISKAVAHLIKCNVQ